MPTPAVFRSTSPEVLETHRENIARGRIATAKWRRFTDETGLEPVIVFHPQGATVSGAHPAPGLDATNPPDGWFWDNARRLLAPALGGDHDRTTGQAVQEQLASMEWIIDPLPGITPIATYGITCLDIDNENARLEALAVTRRGGRAALEVDNAVWITLPQSAVPAVDDNLWTRTRRYLLEDALFTNTPSLEGLLTQGG